LLRATSDARSRKFTGENASISKYRSFVAVRAAHIDVMNIEVGLYTAQQFPFISRTLSVI